MKPSVANKVEVVDQAAMQIDMSNVGFVMKTLTELYEDSIMAVVREYSTNAMDSHFLSGKAGTPIEVTITSSMFSVQDYGLGMSRDEILEEYGLYGFSSKRTTNEASGLLGMGCKSALAYADTFTVTGVKDGRKTVAVIVREDAESVPVINIVAEGPTDDPDGVNVAVPIEAGDSSIFTDRANKLYYQWRDDYPVELNGSTPVNLDSDPEAIKVIGDVNVTADTDVYVLPNKDRYGFSGSTRFVNQGGVPYPYKRDAYGARSYNLVFYTPIGSVGFTPAREALQLDTDMSSRLITRNRETEKAITDLAQREFDACITVKSLQKWHKRWLAISGTSVKGHASERISELCGLFYENHVSSPWGWHTGGRGRAKWTEVKGTFRQNYVLDGVTRDIRMATCDRAFGVTSQASFYGEGNFDSVFFVLDFKLKKPTAEQIGRLKTHFPSHIQDNTEIVIFSGKNFIGDWDKTARVLEKAGYSSVKWDDVPRMPRSKRGEGPKAASPVTFDMALNPAMHGGYDIKRQNLEHLPKDHLGRQVHLYLLGGEDHHPAAAIVRDYPHPLLVVKCRENQKNRLLRENPQVKVVDYDTIYDGTVDFLWRTVTVAEQAWMGYDSEFRDLCRVFDGGHVVDPHLKKLLVTPISKDREDELELMGRSHHFPWSSQRGKPLRSHDDVPSVDSGWWDELEARYPMLKMADWTMMPELFDTHPLVVQDFFNDYYNNYIRS